MVCCCVVSVFLVWLVVNVIVTFVALVLMVDRLYSGIGPVLNPGFDVTIKDKSPSVGEFALLGFVAFVFVSWLGMSFSWLLVRFERVRARRGELAPLLDVERK